MKFVKSWGWVLILLIWISSPTFSQSVITGDVTDELSNEPLIGASIVVKGTAHGTVTDFDGAFELRLKEAMPVTLVFSYTGFSDKELEVSSGGKLKIQLSEDVLTLDVGVEVVGQRISDKQKSSPLTVESMDLLAIKETPSDNFYDGLGSLKGVDLTAASLGFKIVNTRGFNSTSPVRSLQLIDGVDNQAPGLNFSLGNFLGSSELDVLKVDLIQGASSAFYGPNAFNGVISMETKNPFLQKGLSASIKGAERNLLETAIRYADALKNKDGFDFMAFKLNFFYLRADDWEATNSLPIEDSRVEIGNPGRWDAVNTYGDEFFSINDLSSIIHLTLPSAGLGTFYRTGYMEKDLVDYDTRNLKANAALHFRLNPAKEFKSPELILSSSFGMGTTVYQGDNRFSLRDILFFQNRIEVRKKNKYYIRAYATHEDAGNSFDPYFTALRLQELAKSDQDWGLDYTTYWQNNIHSRMKELGYPQLVKIDGVWVFDYEAADQWFIDNNELLTQWHEEAEAHANLANVLIDETQDFFEPGTERFQMAFDSITSLKNTEGGTKFFDKSALYHLAGEYVFNPKWMDEIVVGGSARMYRPNSEGTVFIDTGGVKITNREVGVYAGIEKKFTRKWTINGALRMDKNENYDWLATPAVSVVWSPNVYNYARVSFSSAVRNPTLTDQFLSLAVGRATLLGNLNGFDSLITVESFKTALDSNFTTELEYFDADPIQPEKAKTLEIGYRTTLFEKLYMDAGYYFTWYRDFIGYNLGIDVDDWFIGRPIGVKVFRVSANSQNRVTTQGFSIGLNYYFGNYYMISGNYSWNRLNKSFPDDPIVPAFNTPEHKYNIGISGRNVPVNFGFARLKNVGFKVNYKWIQGFIFENSPQFTGTIPDYGLLDAQINIKFDKIHTTIKIGASNILDNKVFQTYGGPRIGRLGYISIVYDYVKKFN